MKRTDIYSWYEQGLKRMGELLALSYSQRPAFLEIQERFLANIEQTRLLGENNERKSARESFIQQLDTLAVSELHTSFMNLCGPKIPQNSVTKVDFSIYEKADLPDILRVFLCHSRMDAYFATNLYRQLQIDGVKPWLDKEDLLPGQDWKQEIPRAVRNSHVVLVCLSNNSFIRPGYINNEIKEALDVADSQPEGSIFIIPLRLEECHTNWYCIFRKLVLSCWGGRRRLSWRS